MPKFIVGIDVAKKKHDINIYDALNQSTLRTATIKNDIFSYNLLIEYCKKIDSNLSNFIFVCEATGIYHTSLCNYLHSCKLQVAVVNPALIKRFKDFNQVRSVKTDTIDALAIAQYANYKNLTDNYEIRSMHEQLRALTRFRSSEKAKVIHIKIEIRTALDKLTPELSTLIRDVGSKYFISLILHKDNFFDILKIRDKTLAELLRTNSRGKHSQEMAAKIKKALKSSQHNSKNNCDVLKINFLVSQLSYMESELAKIDDSIKILMEEIDTAIETIPGINSTLSAVIIAEIGDISKFASPKQLVAFAGLDPRKSQSGQMELKSGHITKRGSKHLRKALFQAANCLYRYDDYFKKKYDQLSSQGKHHFVCINALARKLLHIIFGMESKKLPYDPTFLQL